MPTCRDKTGDSVAVAPLRLTPADAAAALRVHYETVRELIARELFTVIAPKGRGVGKHIYLHPDEVQVYATEGELALREFRIRKGRLKGQK